MLIIQSPVTEGKKMANRMKNEVVLSERTSPSKEVAATPGLASPVFR